MENQFYNHIIESISEAPITINQDRKILVWNKAAKVMFGYDKVEVQDTSLDLIKPPAYRERHRKMENFSYGDTLWDLKEVSETQ